MSYLDVQGSYAAEIAEIKAAGSIFSRFFGVNLSKLKLAWEEFRLISSPFQSLRNLLVSQPEGKSGDFPAFEDELFIFESQTQR